MDPSLEGMKRNAAMEAAGMVQDGMILGLGTGSTVRHLLVELSRRISEEELNVTGIPTSKATEDLSRRLSIPLTTLDDQPTIDLDIDGADEVDDRLNVIKGGGGAHVREKIVAKASKILVIVVDEDKLSNRLGTKSPVPVEVIPLAVPVASREISNLGGTPRIRRTEGGRAFESDNGNYILDCSFGPIADPRELEAKLKSLTGVVDSGIFADMADLVIVGTKSGARRIQRQT